MMTIKEQFISEIIERIALQKDLLKHSEDSARIEGSIDALLGLLNSIDTILEEHSNEDLEEEINRYLEPIHTSDIQFEPFTQMTRCARHFAEWGAEHLKQ